MNYRNIYLSALLYETPQAHAQIRGDKAYPGLQGEVYFYQESDGVLVFAEIRGLPTKRDACPTEIFAFHIHEGDSCEGDGTGMEAFPQSGSHYNPRGCPHPAHAGDMPPLFGNNGFALSVFFTNRFHVREIIGKTVIIHANVDDFKTQPSGGSGDKIACGVIQPYR